MNPIVARFFQENPDAKYYYHNNNSRVPNPRLSRLPDWVSDPWPTSHETLNPSIKLKETNLP